MSSKSCMKEPGRQQRLDSHQEWPGHSSLPLDQCPIAKGIIQPLAFPLALLNINYQKLWQAQLMMVFCPLAFKPL